MSDAYFQVSAYVESLGELNDKQRAVASIALALAKALGERFKGAAPPGPTAKQLLDTLDELEESVRKSRDPDSGLSQLKKRRETLMDQFAKGTGLPAGTETR